MTNFQRGQQKREKESNLQAVKAEIEIAKKELGRLIDIGAGYNEIYGTSVKLDSLIVTFYRSSRLSAFFSQDE